MDTNVFQLSMKCLEAKDVQLATGDPVKCSGCQAIFNKYSDIKEQDGKQSWKCEFCNHVNSVSLEQEELPTNETISYMLEAAPQKKTDPTKEESKSGDAKDEKDSGLAKDISIVYCIDVSGSMQGMRLECVKQTILGQIEEMHKKYPDRKVGIVTFSDLVKVIGDGSQNVITLDSQYFYDYNMMLKNGIAAATTQFNKPIKETYQDLKTKVQNLRTEGSTALGPGMITSIALAGEGSLGSQVIVCTDGASNLGIGSVGRG